MRNCMKFEEIRKSLRIFYHKINKLFPFSLYLAVLRKREALCLLALLFLFFEHLLVLLIYLITIAISAIDSKLGRGIQIT